LIDRVQWSEVTQHAMLAEFDLGIAPIPDEPYTRGKCGYKLLQYAAAGTPVIASPVGVNEQILVRMGMPSPRDSNEWIDAILEYLGRSAGARAAAGRHARAVVQADYSFDAWLLRWLEATGIVDHRDGEGR